MVIGLQCGIQIDTIGKEALENKHDLYKYEEEVEIPPLAMVDDLVAVQTCGIPSLEMNEYINSKIEQKTLTLNETKCHKVLIRSSDKF